MKYSLQKKLIPAMLLVLMMSAATNIYAQWTNISGLPVSNGANARMFAATFNDANYGYVAGGSSGGTTINVLKDVWQYNPKTNTWLQMPDMPETVGFAASATQIPATTGAPYMGYVVGGVTSTTTFASNKVYTFNTTTHVWSSIANIPVGRNSGYALVIDGKLVIGGGQNSQPYGGGASSNIAFSDAYIYAGGVWGYSSAIAFIGSRIAPYYFNTDANTGYVGCGQSLRNSSGSTHVKDFWKITTLANGYVYPTKVGDYPGGEQAYGSACYVPNNKAAVVGGGSINNNYYLYYPTNDAWCAVDNIPGGTRIGGVSFAVPNDNFAYVGSGFSDKQTPTPRDDFYKYTLMQISSLPSVNLCTGKQLNLNFNAVCVAGSTSPTYDAYITTVTGSFVTNTTLIGSTVPAGVGSQTLSATLPNLTPGSYKIWISTPTNGGISNVLTVNINTTPPQPNGIVGASSICLGQTSVYLTNESFLTAGNGQPGNFIWTISNASVAYLGASNANFNSVPPYTTVIYRNTATIQGINQGTATLSVVGFKNGCSSLPRTIDVGVQGGVPTMTGPAGLQCPNKPLVYQVGNAPNTTYSWTITPATGYGSITSTGNTATFAGSNTTGSNVAVTISLATANAQCGNFSSSRTITLQSSPLPPAAISGPSLVCGNATGTIYSTSSSTSPNINGWSVNAPYSISPISDGNSGNPPLPNLRTARLNGTTEGVALLSVVLVSTLNYCPSTPRTLSVTVSSIPAVPTIVGIATLCTGQTGSFTVATVLGGSYIWSITGNATMTTTGNTAQITATSAGVVLLTARTTNACGIMLSNTFAVTVLAPVLLPPISGSTNICRNTGMIYSLPYNAGYTYNWSTTTNTGTATIVGMGNQATLTGITNGFVFVNVQVSNGACASTSATLPVNINGVAIPMPGTFAGAATICNRSSELYSQLVSYTPSQAQYQTYQWSVSNPAIATVASQGGSFISYDSGTQVTTLSKFATIRGLAPGTVQVNLQQATTYNSCLSAPRSMIVTVVGIAPTITGLASICGIGSTATYSVVSIAGYTYTWSITGSGAI